jgi:hypothetical protein
VELGVLVFEKDVEGSERSVTVQVLLQLDFVRFEHAAWQRAGDFSLRPRRIRGLLRKTDLNYAHAFCRGPSKFCLGRSRVVGQGSNFSGFNLA